MSEHANVLLTAIVRSSRLQAVEEAALGTGASGLTVTAVRGQGEYAHPVREDALVPHLRVEAVVPASLATETIGAVLDAARSGASGDGLVWLSTLSGAWRVRTGSPFQGRAEKEE